MGTEIEMDMRVSHYALPKGKLSVPDFLGKVASTYPLLGTAVISDNSFKIIEDTALQAIRLSLECRDLKDFAHLAVLLTIIQYAKKWERTESSGFWAYICEQLGYKYSESLYAVLTTSVKAACERYRRIFIKDLNGDNSYYSTVLAHAIAPSKSFFALSDFLLRFYKNNLDSSVYRDDPAIDRMVDVLRDRCKGATIEQDEDIRGNVSGIQVGFRALLAQRPIYIRTFLTDVLLKIDALLSGDELGDRDYVDVLLTQWYIGKINESTIKRSAPVHKRTTEIAFSYGKIRASFVLDDDGEPALRIPSIRLSSRDNPILAIFSGNVDVYRQRIGVYGNDYTSTSEEIIIPLSDFSDVDLNDIQVKLSITNKTIYSSDQNFWTGALLFRDGKVVTNKTVDEGSYVLFTTKLATVTFQGDVEHQRRSYFAQLYDIYLQGEAAIYVNSTLLCCSRPPAGSLRFKLPQTQSEYVENGIKYPIYVRDSFSIVAVGQVQSDNLLATIDNGDALIIDKSDEDTYLISAPSANGCYTISLSEGESGRILDEMRLCLVDSYSVKFDKPYYLEKSDEGTLSLCVDSKMTEISLAGSTEKVRMTYGEGEIVVQIPKIRLLLDGEPFPKSAIWKGAITPSSLIRVNCPDVLNVSLTLGGNPISKNDAPIGFEYAIGNAVQAIDSEAEKLPVELCVASDRHFMLDVVFKPCLISPPLFNLAGSVLTWINPHSFIGDDATKLKVSFQSRNGKSITALIKQGEYVISTDFPEHSERYEFEISAVTESTFANSVVDICKDTIIFGNRSDVIFRGETLQISRIIEEGSFVDIKPFFIDDIVFIGKENLGYTDLTGEYPHYTGRMYFITRNGKRYFTDLNPIDIYLVNEIAGRLYITFDQGEGLLIDKSSEYKPELYKYRNPPQKLAHFFTFPDYFEYQYAKEMY